MGLLWTKSCNFCLKIPCSFLDLCYPKDYAIWCFKHHIRRGDTNHHQKKRKSANVAKFEHFVIKVDSFCMEFELQLFIFQNASTFALIINHFDCNRIAVSFVLRFLLPFPSILIFSSHEWRLIHPALPVSASAQSYSSVIIRYLNSSNSCLAIWATTCNTLLYSFKIPFITVFLKSMVNEDLL